MHIRSAVLVSLAATAACGGKTISEPDPTGSTVPSTSTSTSTSTSGSTISPTPVPTSTANHINTTCSNNGSSASGDANSCMNETQFDCRDGTSIDINCQCASTDGGKATGSCSCNGTTFVFDCSQGCYPHAADYARCNLPPQDGDYGGGTSSSSGFSSSG